MKIAKIKNSKDSELSLVIENDDDIIAWGNLRTEKAVNAMCYCCSKYLTTDNDDDNDIMCDGTSIDLYSVAKKFTTDGMVIYSATLTPDIIQWESVLRKELVDQYKTMFSILDEGNIILVNAAGGYFNVEKGTEFTDVVEVDEEELKDFVKHGLIPTNNETDEKYFCYGKDKKFYYDNVLNHDIILRKNGFREAELDTAYKFIYYPSKLGLSRTMWNAYGIKGLRESEVYKEANKPFELTKSDLDRIENYLKGTFEC